MNNKKEMLINAGLYCFSKGGYTKTSVNDIVERAGVAKGLLFYYFGSKKHFYLFLVDYCVEILEKILNSDKIEETDFFDRVGLVMQKRIQFMLKVPSSYDFLMKVYFEENSEVINELSERLKNLDLSQLNLYTNKVDKHKFININDINFCAKLVVWLTDGIFKVIPQNKEQLKHKVVELTSYLEILKLRFYKSEFVN